MHKHFGNYEEKENRSKRVRIKDVQGTLNLELLRVSENYGKDNLSSRHILECENLI